MNVVIQTFAGAFTVEEAYTIVSINRSALSKLRSQFTTYAVHLPAPRKAGAREASVQ